MSEQCTALTVYEPPVDYKKIAEAVARIREAFEKMTKALLEALKPVIEAVAARLSDFYEAMLRSVATPKEWHMMKHAKRWRIRKKYRNRLARRLAEMIRRATK